jgi:hypothetical protein
VANGVEAQNHHRIADFDFPILRFGEEEAEARGEEGEGEKLHTQPLVGAVLHKISPGIYFCIQHLFLM